MFVLEPLSCPLYPCLGATVSGFCLVLAEVPHSVLEEPVLLQGSEASPGALVPSCGKASAGVLLPPATSLKLLGRPQQKLSTACLRH